MNNRNEIPEFERSYADIIKDLGSSAKDLVLNDLKLFVSELKQVKKSLTGEFKKVAIFGVLIALSIPPLLAFLVIALGRALDGQYWLSALIVTAALSLTGVIGMMAAFKKIKRIDLDFSKTKDAMRRESEVISSNFSIKVTNLTNVMKGERRA